MPDLVLHRGSAAVPKYNNPDLVPGMCPTLFTTGASGFGTPDCARPLSFANQVKYYLNLAGRSSWYRHSFMLAVMNIIQRRTAHLQTHFAVRWSRLESVASRLIAVRLNVLCSAKANQAYQCYEMCIPPVSTVDGKFVLPSKYEGVIPDGTLVAVRGETKMSVFSPFPSICY